MSEEEKVIANDRNLIMTWRASGLKIEDFLVKKRGMVRGNKFGI